MGPSIDHCGTPYFRLTVCGILWYAFTWSFYFLSRCSKNFGDLHPFFYPSIFFTRMSVFHIRTCFKYAFIYLFKSLSNPVYPAILCTGWVKSLLCHKFSHLDKEVCSCGRRGWFGPCWTRRRLTLSSLCIMEICTIVHKSKQKFILNHNRHSKNTVS